MSSTTETSEPIEYSDTPYTDITLSRDERRDQYASYTLRLLRTFSGGLPHPFVHHITHFFRNPDHKQLFELFLAGSPGPEKAANVALNMAIATYSIMSQQLGHLHTHAIVLAYLYMYLAIEVSATPSELRYRLVSILRDNAQHWRGQPKL